MRYFWILLLLLFAEQAGAQVWQPDFSGEGQPSSPPWRYDLPLFHQGGGALQLAVPDGIPSGRATLMTSVTLPDAPRWSGRLHLEFPPTNQNHPLLLLCALRSLGEKRYEYLALNFGGDLPKRITLNRVIAEAASPSPQILPLRSVEPLLTSPELLDQTQDLAFALSYSPQGGFRLELEDLESDRPVLLITGDSSPQLALAKQNSFGLSCVFSPKGHHAWSFQELKIAPLGLTPPPTSSLPLPPSSHPDPTPDEPEPAPSPASPFLLSEVMPYPSKGVPEYVELYNTSDAPTSLRGHRIYAGSDEEHLHGANLPDQLIPPHSYVLLTKQVDLLRSAFPQIPTSVPVVRLTLPRLTNKQGLVILTFVGQGPVDGMAYTPELLPPKTKKSQGIAFERKATPLTSADTDWKPAGSAPLFATPGLPPSAISSFEAPAEGGEDLASLLILLEQQPKVGCRWWLFALDGSELASGSGQAARDTLLLLKRQPTQFFLSLAGTARRSPLLLRVELTHEDGRTELQTHRLCLLR